MTNRLIKLTAFVAVMMMSSYGLACQECGCNSGQPVSFGPAVNGGGFYGGGQADYGDPMANCGRGITNAAAAGLWAGYCTDNCSYQGCSGGCRLGGGGGGGIFSGGGRMFNGGGCGGGGGYVNGGHGGGFVPGFAGDYGYGAPVGYSSCEPAAPRGGCKLFGGKQGRSRGKLFGGGGGKLFGGGLFGGGGGGGGCGCDSGCFGWPTNCGCGGGGGGGGIFGGSGGGMFRGGGLFSRKRGGGGGGLFSRRGARSGCGGGGGGCNLFGGGGGGGGGMFSKIFARKSRGQDFYFNEFAGTDYGQVDFGYSVAGSLTGACGCGQTMAMPMNTYDANMPMTSNCGGCNATGGGAVGTIVPDGQGTIMQGGDMGNMEPTVGADVQVMDGASSITGEIEPADSAVDIAGEAVEAIQEAVQSGAGDGN